MKIQSPRQFLARLSSRRRSRSLSVALTACLLSGGAISSLRAADGTWTVNADGAWGDPGNWLNGTVADGANSTANFAYGITVNRTVTNDSPRTIGNLFFDDTGTNATVDTTTDSTWILAGTAANPLTFSTTGGTSTISSGSNVGYGNQFSIQAVLAGTNNLVFNSTTATTASQRYLQISAANTYTGTTAVSNGFLDVGANNIAASTNGPLGNSASAIIVGNANSVASGFAPNIGLQVFSSGAAAQNFTISRDIDSSATADVSSRTDIRFYNNTAAATGTLTISGNWTLGATTTHSYGLDAQQVGQTLNFTGNITGGATGVAFRLNDYGQGNGTIRLAGNNSYLGGTLVEIGTLVIGNNAPATGPGALGNNVNLTLASGGTTTVNGATNPATIAAVTDGAYTVGKTVTLTSNTATPAGGAAVQQAYSWTLGGTSATASSFTGNVNSPNATFSRTLNLTQSAGGTTTFSGVLNNNTDAANVTVVEKTGAGTVALTGANTYDGGTRITGGTLLVNGGATGTSSGSGTSAVTVGVVSAAQTAVSGSTVGPVTGTGTLTTRQINNIPLSVAAGLQVGQTVTGTNTTTGTALPAGTVLQSVSYTAAGTASIVISNSFTVATGATATFTDLAFGALTTTGTLGGSGVINPTVATPLGGAALVTINTGSILAPGIGAAPGILSIVATQATQPTAADGTASLNLLSGSNLTIKLNGAAVGTGYDQVNVQGTVALGTSVTLSLSVNGFTATNGQKFVILNNDLADTVFGTFSNAADNTVITAGGQQFRINYNAVGGTDSVANDIVLTAIVAPVPEPGVWAMLTVGAGALGLLSYRRMRTA